MTVYLSAGVGKTLVTWLIDDRAEARSREASLRRGRGRRRSRWSGMSSMMRTAMMAVRKLHIRILIQMLAM